jgi:hypothetical protein
VQIKLFNQLGQEVAKISDGWFSRGNNSINFYTRDYCLASGLYYIQLSAGNGLASKIIYIEK